MICLGHGGHIRTLNDVDIVVASFQSVPKPVVDYFLSWHIHPAAPEGKIVIQLVAPEEALRIDIFRAIGSTLARTQSSDIGTCPIQLVSIEDLAARAASLVMGLERGSTVPLKHAEDFHRLMNVIDRDKVEIAWQDHRKQNDPSTFRGAAARIPDLIQSRGDLLVTPKYAKDVDEAEICPRCQDTGPFHCASPQTILSILGYL